MDRVEKKKKPGRERNLNADLIRCVAVFSVISVHFLLNSGFYSQPVVGADMLALCIFRSFFMTCVPLFLMLTGFLMWKKTLSRQYYGGLWKTLEIYLLASIACLLYKKLVAGEAVTLKSAVLSVLAFKGANYAWYIEMYIGLFLMIPFLNLAYHGLEGKKQKQVLVMTMIALTMLPKLLNMFNLTQPGWWQSPGSSTSYNKLVPSFFTGMYPITYYFLGAYLREYGWKLSRRVNVLLLVVAVLCFGWYNYYRSDGGTFVWGNNSTWGGENLITAALWFNLLLQVRLDRLPRIGKKALSGVSGIALGIYLLSWIFDQLVYKGLLIPRIPTPGERWKFYPLTAAAVFLGSAAAAALLYLLRALLHRLFSWCVTYTSRKTPPGE